MKKAQLEKVSSMFETLYRTYNRRRYVSPDPLQFLYDYNDPADREIVGFVASSLAYGRVATIIASVRTILEPMGTSPRSFLLETNVPDWEKIYEGFRHRFTDRDDIVALFHGLQLLINKWGSMEALMAKIRSEEGSLLGALDRLVVEIEQGRPNSLLARPRHGSACKRHLMFLRWMVRSDDVDPGGWKCLSPAELVVPLDTHMYKICRYLKFTDRGTADLKTALEATTDFAAICPEDPVKYDFTLTRFGIRGDLNAKMLLDVFEK